MKRIVILGPGNAGKSTLSKKLGQQLKISVHHLDKYFWKPDWVMISDTEKQLIQDKLISGDEWILDGGYSRLLDERIARADTVIIMDFPRRVLIPRWLKRMWINRGISRSDMGGGNVERFNWEYLRMLLKGKKQTKRAALMKANNPHLKVYVLKNKRQVQSFLAAAD